MEEIEFYLGGTDEEICLAQITKAAASWVNIEVGAYDLPDIQPAGLIDNLARFIEERGVHYQARLVHAATANNFYCFDKKHPFWQYYQ